MAGVIYTWGDNASGQLGDGTTTTRLSPTAISLPNGVVSAFAGLSTSGAIGADGTLWMWGSNLRGQLGDGTTTQRLTPTQIGVATNWQSVSSKGDHTLGLRTDGTLWAWGANNEKQLGDGTAIDRYVPTQIGSLTNWESVAAGLNYSVAVKKDGTLWTWGYNAGHQMGQGDTAIYSVPTQVGGVTSWASASAGFHAHSNAVRDDGTRWMWGSRGDNLLSTRTTPTQIGVSENWVNVSTGQGFSTGLHTSGTIWGLGNNFYGELGDGTTVGRTAPVIIGAASNDWASVSAGGGHGIGVRTNGTVWAWGGNFSGEIGDGTTTQRNSPTPVPGLIGVSFALGGGSHSLAFTADAPSALAFWTNYQTTREFL